MLREQDYEMISKFAKETVEEVQKVSKMSNETDAASLDASSNTVSRKFTEMIRMVKPVLKLEEKGIVRVQEVDPQTDIAVFTVQLQQAFTWTEFDKRSSEISILATGSATFQSYTAPAYRAITVTTKTSTLFLHDNISLVNPVRMAEIMAQCMEEIASAKEQDAYTALADTASYTASVSLHMAGGFHNLPSGSYVKSGSVLLLADLTAAKKYLMTTGARKIVPDVVLMATEQYFDVKNEASLAPGQTSNGYYKSAIFNEDGELVRYDGMEIVHAQEMATITTGYFASSNGRWAYVGKKGLMLGRGECPAKNKVETFRDPKNHGTEVTLDVSYKTDVLYSKATILIGASNT